MGDIAEMVLNGILCEGCGVYLGDAVDYPRRCRECQKTQRVDALKTATHVHHRATKINCHQCDRRVKITGLTDHMRDVHGVMPNVPVEGRALARPSRTQS